MAVELYAFAVTIPVGGTPGAPQSFDIPMPPRIVQHVDILVPPGPRGNVGIALGAAGTITWPANAGSWIVTDDETLHWDVEGAIDSGAWQFFAYNLGKYEHTIFIRFLVGLVQAASSGLPSSPLSLTAS